MLFIEHTSRQNAIFVALLLPMFSQYTISIAHIQLEHHIACLYLVSRPFLLSMSNQYIISSPHHQWEPYLVHVISLHFSCPCLVRMPPKALCPYPVRKSSFLPLYRCTVNTPPLLPMSNQSRFLLAMSSQFITYPVHIQLEYHLSYSHLVNTPYLLPWSCQNTTCPIHVESLHHLTCKSPITHCLSFSYPVSSSPLFPISGQNTTSNSKGLDL